MSTIPERRGTFFQVVDAILHRQSRPVHRLHVYLYRYGGLDPSLPRDERLEYHVDEGGKGPWVRYLPADDLENDDVLMTLDDDTSYPGDYVARGVAALESAGARWAVSFGGILWDPLGSPHTYMQNCWRFLASRAQDRDRTVAFPMGLVSFFRARDVKGIVQLPVPGLNTNDDMIVALGLQQRGVSIRCAARPADWIRDLPTATSPDALYRRDVDTRYRTFGEMVDLLGFDSTAGELSRYLEKARRILVLSQGLLPPLPGTEDLDRRLRDLCTDDASVHVLGPIPSSLAGDVACRMNAPYDVHVVAVPEPGGRLDRIPPVRAWRNWRVDRETRRKWASRERLARERLQPTEVYHYQEGRLVPEAPV
jgi:hypothetical protein